MKKILTLLPLFLAGFLVLAGFMTPEDKDPNPAETTWKYSKKVNSIIQGKCHGCHSPQGKSEKAKAKLLWDELPNLPAEEQFEKLNSIAGVLDEGAMPPAPFLQNNPDKKLTDKESATLKKWAEKTAKKAAK